MMIDVTLFFSLYFNCILIQIIYTFIKYICMYIQRMLTIKKVKTIGVSFIALLYWITILH